VLEDAFDQRNTRRRAPASHGEPLPGGPPLSDTIPAEDAPSAPPAPHPRFVGAEIDDEDPGGDAQTSWRSLLRILAFARPNAGMALLGCGLSLARTSLSPSCGGIWEGWWPRRWSPGSSPGPRPGSSPG
jgi:hypothetical protein